jgi:hypothetical protein
LSAVLRLRVLEPMLAWRARGCMAGRKDRDPAPSRRGDFVSNRSCAYGLAAALAIFGACATAVESWPLRPIMMVVPFGAGGSLDIPARSLAAELSIKLGQQIVVENRPEDFQKFIGDEVAKWGPIIKAAGISMQARP